MCGIAGLFAKTPGAQERLGTDLAGMVRRLADRGPDSAGMAIYRDPAGDATKASVLQPGGAAAHWEAIAAELNGGTVVADAGDQAVLAIPGDAADATALVAERHPELVVMSAGRRIETSKRAGHPGALLAATGLEHLSGSHAIAHTRMATESAVTTEHSHPFSTGSDLCLVHNGSLSNHNRLRRELRRHGVRFRTDNDSEVAAGYLTWRLAEGDTLEAALAGALEALDGFFTFAVGTADGFAVLRDPVACKPAVLAETDDWVAMASEYRAIAALPGAEDATTWEPEPARVYAWSREAIVA